MSSSVLLFYVESSLVLDNCCLCGVSYKGLVAEALRQLLGEQNYKQDEVLPPGYYTGTAATVRHQVRLVASSSDEHLFAPRLPAVDGRLWPGAAPQARSRRGRRCTSVLRRRDVKTGRWCCCGAHLRLSEVLPIHGSGGRVGAAVPGGYGRSHGATFLPPPPPHPQPGARCVCADRNQRRPIGLWHLLCTRVRVLPWPAQGAFSGEPGQLDAQQPSL